MRMSKLPNVRSVAPRLPGLLKTKIYKTGQTRGADDDSIYQNRVSRASTVLIPYQLWDQVSRPPRGESSFSNGFIVLISPSDYFRTTNILHELEQECLVLGQNAVIFFETRSDWDAYNPNDRNWKAADNRTAPLGGEYVARIPGTTATAKSEKISDGFSSTGRKGAGIRLFEYASQSIIRECRVQLEALFWLCHDALEAVMEFGMTARNSEIRKQYCLNMARDDNLLNMERLARARMINSHGIAICPFCLEGVSGYGFFSRLAQAVGREVHDLTVTEVNLFHIKELKYGQYNHRPYNLGWGHHHCNVVVKDSGIDQTLRWMFEVINRNQTAGYFSD